MQKNKKSGAAPSKKKKNDNTALIVFGILCAAAVIAFAVNYFITSAWNHRGDDTRLGNTPSNTANSGMAVDLGDKVVYSNSGLYVKPDDGDAYCLCEDHGQSLAYADGYIYYCNYNDNNRAYRVDMNGNKERLTDISVEYINIYGDTVYFACIKELPYAGIYRMDLDGGHFTKLADKYVSALLVYKDRIFFCDKDKNDHIYSMRLDGSRITPVYNGRASCLLFDTDTQFLYFIGSDGIYRCLADGSSRARLMDKHAAFIALDGETVFFSYYAPGTPDPELDTTSYIARTDTTFGSYAVIRDDAVLYLCIGNEQLYFNSLTKNSVMRTDYNGENGFFVAGGEYGSIIDSAAEVEDFYASDQTGGK